MLMPSVYPNTVNLNSYQFTLGIDVSKDTLDFALLGGEKTEYRHFTNNESGYSHLVNWLHKAGECGKPGVHQGLCSQHDAPLQERQRGRRGDRFLLPERGSGALDTST
jgi:hypothetical protein